MGQEKNILQTFNQVMVNLHLAYGYLVSLCLAEHFILRHLPTEYAAVYDKLPISAFVSEPKTPDPDMDLPNLQFWNCMDYGVTTICKQFIGSMDYELYTRDYGSQLGKYVITIDNYHDEPDTPDYSTAETPSEHKSHNLIALNNGQFALYPNNRMRIYDNSLTPKNPKMPDFKVSTRIFRCRTWSHGEVW